MRRRLAAILHADVVGYSRLMEGNETRTFRELKALVDTAWLPVLARHGGRLVNMAGDALLVEFASAVSAVQGALDLQAATHAYNTGQPADRRVLLRIGVTLGEVLVDGDNILGEEVNLAARLQALAEPGAVMASTRVRESVEGKLDCRFVDLGTRQVKNISRPVQVHRVVPVHGLGDVATVVGAAPRAALRPVPASQIPTVAASVAASARPAALADVPPVPTRESPAPPAADWRLLGSDRAGTPVDVRLEGARLQRPEGIVLGRLQRYCDLTFDNDSISRRHARFRLIGGSLTVEDLGSTNGTAVDGQRIEAEKPVPVRDGSRISMGEIKVVLSRA